MCVKSLMSGMAIGNAFFQFGNIKTFWYMYPHKVGTFLRWSFCSNSIEMRSIGKTQTTLDFKLNLKRYIPMR